MLTKPDQCPDEAESSTNGWRTPRTSVCLCEQTLRSQTYGREPTGSQAWCATGSRRSRYLATPGTGDESDSGVRQVFAKGGAQKISSPRGAVSGSHEIALPGKAVSAALPASHRSPAPELRKLGLCMSE